MITKRDLILRDNYFCGKHILDLGDLMAALQVNGISNWWQKQR